MTRRDWLLVLILLIVGLLLALPILTYPLGRDQGIFAVIGRELLSGKQLFADVWDLAPPAIYYLYAAAIWLFGENAASVRVIDLALIAGVVPVLYWLGLRLRDRYLAVLGASAFVVFYLTEDFWTLTQKDGIAILPLAISVWALWHSLNVRRYDWLWVFVAGVAAGVAIWFKYPLAIIVLGVGFAQTVLKAGGITPSRNDRRRSAILGGIAFIAGIVVVGVAGLAYCWVAGFLDAFLETFQSTVHYATQSYTHTADDTVWKAGLTSRWRHWWLLILMAIGWLLAALRFQGRKNRYWILIWVWLAGGLLAVLIQAKGFDYHWLPVLPPLVLLAIDNILDIVVGLVSRKRVGTGNLAYLKQVSAVLILAVLLLVVAVNVWVPAWQYLAGQESREVYYARFRGGAFLASDSLAVSRYLQERVASGDSLYIWGYRAEIYFMSHLNPATRFISNLPLVAAGYPVEWKQENVDTLWAALPPYTLVVKGDFLTWITGRDADSNTLLQEYTELNNWLMYNYELETEIGPFIVWRRKLTP